MTAVDVTANAVEQVAEHKRLEKLAYDRYYAKHLLVNEATRAEGRLALDIPPDERAECERLARQLPEARRESEFGLNAYKHHVRRGAELLEERPDEFIAWARAEDAKVKAAAEALRPQLEKYLSAWADAAARWDGIRRAVRVHLNQSATTGFYPGDATSELANVIECPIPPSALTEITSVMPRPQGMA